MCLKGNRWKGKEFFLGFARMIPFFWCLLIFSFTNKAATYYAKEGSPLVWSDNTSWSSVSPTGASCGCIPGAGDNVIINGSTGNIVMTVDGNYSIANVTIGDGSGTDNNRAYLNVSGTNTLTITGTTSFNLGNKNNRYRLDAQAGIINVNGAVIWAATTGQNDFRVSTGTVTFALALTLPNNGAERIIYTGGAGTMNFNGGLTDAGAGVITTVPNCTANMGGSYSNSVSAMTWDPASTVVFTGGVPTVTPNFPISFGNIQMNAGINVTFAAGTINVAGNWTNLGGTFTPGLNTVTFNGGGTQTITKAGGETFYNLTSGTTGPLTLGSNITVTNLLTMTSGNYNLNAFTLTLGASGAASTLTRTAGTMYGGTFQRFIPTGLAAAGVSSTGAPTANYYGLFPVGSSTAYRPVEVNSTSAPTVTGYISASHTNATTSTDAAYSDNEAVAIQRVSDMKSTLSTSLTDGTYDLYVTFNGFDAGAAGNLRMETLPSVAGAGVGAHIATDGTDPTAPRVKRTGLAAVQLANDFVAGTVDKINTPIKDLYYYAREGSPLLWSDNTSWSNISPSGASCGCIPGASDKVIINGETGNITMTVDGNYSITNVTIGDGGLTDNNNATLATSGTNTLTITGILLFNSGNKGNTYRLDAQAGIINVNGSVVWAGTNGTSSIRVSTGTITFASLLTLPNSANEDITYTGAGTINFNGGLTDLGTGVVTTVAGCTANFGGSYTNNNNNMTWNATSNAVFNGGAPAITPSGTILTFGNFQINSGIAVTQAGDIRISGNWINNGGTIPQAGGPWIVTFTGALKTIGGAVGTAFPNLNIGTAAIDATISLTGGFTYSCINLTIDDGAGGAGTPVTLTHSSTEVLNISGYANLIQPTTTGQTNVWYINAGTATVTGNLDFDGASILARITKVVVTGGSLTVNGAAGIDWMEAQPAATAIVTTEVVSLTTGAITIANPVTMNTGSGTINVTGSGTIRFNGAPALDFGNNPGANPNAPVFTTISGTVAEFAGNLTATNTAPVFAAGSTEKFTANSTITPNAAIAFGNVEINAAPTVTLAGNISVTGNWTNLGGTFNPSTFGVIFNGTGTQIIAKTVSPPETFYHFTSATTGGGIVQLGSDIMISNAAGGTLTMTTGNFNLNGFTLTLGNGVASALSRAAGIMYGGTFKRYWPAVAITSGSGNYYGLFPVGAAAFYRPIEINSTVNPVSSGYISAIHTDALTVTDVTYTDNEGDAIQTIADMKSTLSASGGFSGGAYDLNVTFNDLSPVGVTTDLKLETYTASAMGSVGCQTTCGPPLTTGGTVDAPIMRRGNLTDAELANDFVVGTKNNTVTPIRKFYYSRKTGNWDDATVGNGTWSYTPGGVGPSCDCVPIVQGYVVINPGHTVDVNVPSAIQSVVNIDNTATLNGTADFIVAQNITTTGSGKFTPTTGIWTVGGDVTLNGTSSSNTTTSAMSIAGNLSILSTSILSLNAGLTVSGNLTADGTFALGINNAALNGSGKIISGGGTITTSAATTLTLSNNKTIAAGTNLTIASHLAVASGAVITNNGTITLTTSTPANITGVDATSTWTNAAGSMLNIGGALLATGTLNASASPNTVNYTGIVAQTVKLPNASAYYNLICSAASGTPTKTLGGTPITVTNLLTVQDAVILDESTNVISGAGGLTMTGTPELKLQRGAGGTYPELTGTYSLTGGTVTINQTAGTCTVRGAVYYNLKFTGNRPYNMTAVASITNNFDIQATSRMTSNAVLTVGNAFTHSSTSAATALTNNITAGSYTQSAGTITDNGYTITINGAGGWTKSGGTFTATGTVRFTGGVAQTISGAASTTYNNLTIANTSATGVTLAQPVTILGTGVLTLTDGLLYSDAINLLTMNSGSSVSGVSNASFVHGPAAKAGSTDFTFPIGKDVLYRPIAVTALSGSETFTATYFHSNPNLIPYDVTSKDGTLNHISQSEYWILNRAGAVNAFVTLSWDSYSGGVDNLPALAVARWDGAVWRDHGNGGTTGGPDPATGTVISSAIVSSFSPFTLASTDAMNPLPVELLSFDANPNGNSVNVTWTTASEFNSDYFTVQRSQDGVIFEDAARVEAAGNSNAVRVYTADDYEPFKGISYYRLKQTDNDGKYVFSDLVAVKFGSEPEISVYPNPAFGAFNVKLDAKEGDEVLVVVRDVVGREFYSKVVVMANASEVIAIDPAGKIAAGIYVVVAASHDSVYEKRIVIK